MQQEAVSDGGSQIIMQFHVLILQTLEPERKIVHRSFYTQSNEQRFIDTKSILRYVPIHTVHVPVSCLLTSSALISPSRHNAIPVLSL